MRLVAEHALPRPMPLATQKAYRRVAVTAPVVPPNERMRRIVDECSALQLAIESAALFVRLLTVEPLVLLTGLSSRLPTTHLRSFLHPHLLQPRLSLTLNTCF